MKRKLVCGMIVLSAIFLGGCGATLTELTAEEEEVIVQYSAKVVAKHNVRLGQGIQLYEPPEEDTDDDSQSGETETQDAVSEGVAKSGSTAGSAEQAQTDGADAAQKVSMTEALGIKGISFTYKGADAAKDMQSGNLYIDEPASGKKYIVLTFEAKNTTNKDIDVNILTMKTSFSATIGDEMVNAKSMPVLAEDMPTFTGTIKQNSTQKMVIYFEFSEGMVREKDSVSLEAEVNGNKYRIDL